MDFPVLYIYKTQKWGKNHTCGKFFEKWAKKRCRKFADFQLNNSTIKQTYKHTDLFANDVAHTVKVVRLD